jgi:hypothetical protein
MVQLTLCAGYDAPPITFDEVDFWITGGLLADGLSRRLIASFAAGAWVHDAQRYASFSVGGRVRLLFGTLTDPWHVSDVIGSLYVCGSMLWTHDAPVAVYMPEQDMWRATIRSVRWRSMRIVDAAALRLPIESPPLAPLNLRDAEQSTR